MTNEKYNRFDAADSVYAHYFGARHHRHLALPRVGRIAHMPSEALACPCVARPQCHQDASASL